MNQDKFKKELKELLIKYNASLCFSCADSSDTYGIYDSEMGGEINGKPFTLAKGWSVEIEDL